jgi:hypothetical protein
VLSRACGGVTLWAASTGFGGAAVGGGASAAGECISPTVCTITTPSAGGWRRDQVVQEQLEQLRISVNALPDRWQADIEEESETLRSEYEQALEQQRGELLLERLVGIVMVALGVLLATWGNLA